MRIAVGREHLEHAVLDAQNRDVERAAAEIVDGNHPRVPLVESVRERRRRRFVDDPKDLETGNASGIARGRALRVVEVRRHRNHRAVDFVVGFTLRGKKRFRATLQLAEDQRRNLGRRELALAETDPQHAAGIADDSERKMALFVAHVVPPLPHEPLDRIGRALRIDQQPPLRVDADRHHAVFAHRHNRRDERITGLVTEHDRHAVADIGNEGVRGAEINTNHFAHIMESLPRRIRRTRRLNPAGPAVTTSTRQRGLRQKI